MNLFKCNRAIIKLKKKSNKQSEFLMANFKENLVLKEIEILQERIDSYDKHTLIIKGWAITIWSGIWLFIINQMILKIDFSLIIAGLGSIFAILFFWGFDSLYKYYQRAFIVRTKQIEDIIKEKFIEITNSSNQNDSLILFNPTGNKSDAYRYLHKLWRCILLRNVSVFYLSLIGISLFVLSFISSQDVNLERYMLLWNFLGIMCSFLSIILLIWGHDKPFNCIANLFKKKEEKYIKILIQKSTANELKQIKKERKESYDKIIKDLLSNAKNMKIR